MNVDARTLDELTSLVTRRTSLIDERAKVAERLVAIDTELGEVARAVGQLMRPRSADADADADAIGAANATLSARLVELLRTQPNASLAEMADALYGDSGDVARNKARSLLTSLARRGLVTSPSHGIWRLAMNPMLAAERPAAATEVLRPAARAELEEERTLAVMRAEAATQIEAALLVRSLSTRELRKLLEDFGPQVTRRWLDDTLSNWHREHRVERVGAPGSYMWQLAKSRAALLRKEVKRQPAR